MPDRTGQLSRIRGLAAVAFTLWAAPALGAPMPVEFQNVDIEEHLGQSIALDVELYDEQGRPRELGEFFDGERPVIITMGYYKCPMLCGLVLNAVTEGLKELDWTPGDQFQVITVSIDPTETHQLARANKANYLQDYGRAGAAEGWHFMVGEDPQVRRLAEALGFRYYYDAQREEYAHAAAIFVITPDGRISRYLYGISYPAKQLRLALLEASDGRIGSALDKLILFCYHYDPASRGYTLFAMRLMRIGGVGTLILLGGLVGSLILLERRRARRRADGETQAHPSDTGGSGGGSEAG